MKQFQICTHGNEQISKGIQDKLFELGYEWNGGNCHQNTDAQWLSVWSDDYSIAYHYAWDDSEGWPTITIEELFAMKPEKKTHEFTQAQAFEALRKQHGIDGEIKIKEGQ